MCHVGYVLYGVLLRTLKIVFLNVWVVYVAKISTYMHVQCTCVWPRPQASPSFSMLHAEKREGLTLGIYSY